MPDTVKIPGVGPVNKKYAMIGAAAAAGFVGYAYWRNRQAAAATPADTTDTTDTSALDNANLAADDSSYAYSDGSGYAYGGAPIYQSPISGYPTTPTGNAPTSDPEWAQAAVEWLGNVGVDTQAASHAVSTYLANLCLTGQEADYVRQALAGLGDPPQTHHTIQICSTGGDGGSSTNPPMLPGLHVISTDKSGVTLGWTAVPSADNYHLHVEGNGISHGYTVNGTSARIGSLAANKKYYFSGYVVVSGKKGPTTPLISGTTTK